MPRLRRLSLSSIESLEARICPSVTVAQLDLDSDGNADDLRIVGGNESTKIKLTDEGLGQGSILLDLDINGDGDFADIGDLQGSLLEIADDSSVIRLELGAGNDQVTYSIVENLSSSSRKLVVDLGNGNDKFIMMAHEQIVGSDSLLDINVVGGAGNDTTAIFPPSVFNSSVLFHANMGNGNDQVLMGGAANSPEFVDFQSSFEMDVELGAGTNSFLALICFDVGTISQGDVSFDITGGSGKDEVEIYTVGEIGNASQTSTFTMNAELGGGNDLFGFLMTELNIDPTGILSVRGSGGAGNDVLAAEYAAEQPLSTLKGLAQFDLIGGAGNDKLFSRLADDVGQLLLLGELRVNLEGQDGTDLLEAYLAVTQPSTGNYSLVAKGGSGKDTFILSLQRNGAPLTLGTTGKLLIDGGLGVDIYRSSIPEALVDIQSVETFV